MIKFRIQVLYFIWQFKNNPIYFSISELLEATVGRDRVLPHPPSSSSRFEASKLAARQSRHHQVGGFRTRPSIFSPSQELHPRGGHPVVPRAWNSAGRERLLHGSRRLESGLHLRRNGQFTKIKQKSVSAKKFCNYSIT